jgi:DNA-binding winged helix-turn-helix (wHTH) protein
MAVEAQPTVPIGITAFDSLQAESEPWLEKCFVPPVHFDLIAGARSVLVFGEAGSGKTALFQMLRRRLATCSPPGGPPTSLVVEWQPRPPPPGLSGSPAAEHLLSQVLSCCASQFLAHAAAWPDPVLALASDVQETLAWLVHHCLGDGDERQIAAQLAAVPEPVRPGLQRTLRQPPVDRWLTGQRPAIVVNALVAALREVGLNSVYVLSSPEAGDEWPAQEGLRIFLSSPTLFENPNFLYKMILPAGLRDPLAKAGAATRRRIDEHSLEWMTEDLIGMVLRRTTLAVGKPVHELQEVCDDPTLVDWLKRTGGTSPRGWLRCVTPLIARYLRRGHVISAEEWQIIRAQGPPPLHLDEETGTVTVGWYRLPALADVPLALLRFLWERRDRVCTRRELYYRAYLPSSYPDTPLEEIRDLRKDYEHVLDQAISRLREKVEPCPRRPLYIVTARGTGYKLEHWR